LRFLFAFDRIDRKLLRPFYRVKAPAARNSASRTKPANSGCELGGIMGPPKKEGVRSKFLRN
jgi:hypothetical protein